MPAPTISSSRDLLLFELDSAVASLTETLAGISEAEYCWEPLPAAEQASDRLLPADRKRAWRVFQQAGAWTYDYTPEKLLTPAFTTIAWIMCHIAQTAEMYLYCVQSGQPEGVDRLWDDLPVPYGCEAARVYIVQALAQVRASLASIPAESADRELNRLTPAPWGELRPTYVNLWGGCVEHAILHSIQIAARKDRIRYGH